ncbi:MAG TPA: hypothetical protein VIM11_01660 [Tepidisphaeraceae bacterium]|jgi:ABC-type Fe3+-hydroxamate transport system substrate-binding protein
MHPPQVAILLALLTLFTLAGCQGTTAPESINTSSPAENLRLVAQGTNTELKFKATQPGTLTASNFTTGEFLYQARLKAGDTFTLIPNSSHATLNKDTVYLAHDTNTRDEYRLHFLEQ